ncbi:MAG: glycosyltransferase [Nanoarchaeota archaeon]|nr:glycosyltransferase [Nanoarchaeota archaeon]
MDSKNKLDHISPKNKVKNPTTISIIVIFDQIREEKLRRLCQSLKPSLTEDTEVIFIHESEFAAELPLFPINVQYSNVPPKQGIPFNRNQGIHHAQGKIIVFIDDDCWVQDNWLSSFLKHFEDDSIMAITSGTKIPPSNFIGDCIAALGFPGGGSLGFEKVWKVSADNFTNHLAVGNCALRRDIFDTIGLFDESMKSGAEDAEFSYRLEKAGIVVKYEPAAYAYHEARTSLSSFIHWQLRRGRANYQFRRKVGPVGSFIKLRLWSAKNILGENIFNPQIPFIFILLGSSFVLQQAGYFLEKRAQSKNS